MLRNRETSDVFNSLDEIYLVFTSKKQISSTRKRLAGGSGVRLYDGLDLKLFSSVGRAGASCLLLGPSGSNWCFLLLMVSVSYSAPRNIYCRPAY